MKSPRWPWSSCPAASTPYNRHDGCLVARWKWSTRLEYYSFPPVIGDNFNCRAWFTVDCAVVEVWVMVKSFCFSKCSYIFQNEYNISIFASHHSVLGVDTEGKGETLVAVWSHDWFLSKRPMGWPKISHVTILLRKRAWSLRGEGRFDCFIDWRNY